MKLLILLKFSHFLAQIQFNFILLFIQASNLILHPVLKIKSNMPELTITNLYRKNGIILN